MKMVTIFYSLLLCSFVSFAKPPKKKRKRQTHESVATHSLPRNNRQELKDILNELVTYADGSIISELDLDINVITITNPYDNSTVIIPVEDILSVSDAITEELYLPYAERVANWFEDQTIPATNSEDFERHRFAQRVDEIMLLYGRPSYFTSNCGQLVENLTLPGTIITQDGRQLDGIFEYAQTESTNDGQKHLLYHRFLHPNSRAVPI